MTHNLILENYVLLKCFMFTLNYIRVWLHMYKAVSCISGSQGILKPASSSYLLCSTFGINSYHCS